MYVVHITASEGQRQLMVPQGTEIERAAKTLALVPDNLREEFTDAELVEFVRSFEQVSCRPLMSTGGGYNTCNTA